MIPRSLYIARPYTYSVVDSRPNQPSSSTTTSKTGCTDFLYGIVSDSSKPFRDKAQTYSKSLQFQGNGRLTERYVYPNGVKTITEDGVVGASAPSTTVGNSTTAYNNAVSDLYDAIRGGIDLSIDGFQARKTLDLTKKIFNVRSHLKTMADLIGKASFKTIPHKGSKSKRVLSRRNHQRLTRKQQTDQIFRTPLKEVGSAWLAFTYGVKPTLQTIFDLVKGEAVRCGNSLTIQKANPNGTMRKHVRGKERQERTDSTNYANAKIVTKFTSDYSQLIGGTYQPGTTFLEGLSRLTSLNPISIAWELLPFSFVVDWFVNIGGYLRSMESALLSRMLGTFKGFVTSIDRHTTKHSYTQFGYSDAAACTFGGGFESSSLIVHKSRRLITAAPLPRLPQFRANLSSGRLLNAAALLTTFLRK